MQGIFIRRVFILICIVQNLVVNSLLAVSSTMKNGEIKPARVSTPPQIDGNLNDEAWQHAPLGEPFLTYNPTHGEHLPQETFVWLAYDDENLFFAFRCLDTEPTKIKTSITQRDHMFSDDWVGLSLDGLGNRQSAYDLFVNPNGIQGDILYHGRGHLQSRFQSGGERCIPS